MLLDKLGQLTGWIQNLPAALSGRVGGATIDPVSNDVALNVRDVADGSSLQLPDFLLFVRAVLGPALGSAEPPTTTPAGQSTITLNPITGAIVDKSHRGADRLIRNVTGEYPNVSRRDLGWREWRGPVRYEAAPLTGHALCGYCLRDRRGDHGGGPFGVDGLLLGGSVVAHRELHQCVGGQNRKGFSFIEAFMVWNAARSHQAAGGWTSRQGFGLRSARTDANRV
ncbi:hypothetical protein ACFYUD_11690 [Nocardia tengchongensis]|uniref:hypothetical protein n=1 Tax=Nocardia tengchongensis TaxID=2055889 RepID=UPI0036CF9848